MPDLMKRIKNNINDFSKGQKLIADFITEHSEKAAYMTALRLGNTVGTSESTVVRFAIELGYDGYPEMQKSLRSYIKNHLTSLQRIEITNNRIGKDDVLCSVLTQDIARIRATLEAADNQAFNNAVEKIAAARRIYIFGAMNTSIIARFLANYFQVIFDNVTFVRDISTGGVLQQLIRINKDDTLIVVSFPRYSKSALDAASYAKSCGADIIAVTDSELSPLASLADCTLTAKSDMVSFADSLVAPLSVINALIVAIGIQKQTEIENIYTKLEKIWDDYDVYEKD